MISRRKYILGSFGLLAISLILWQCQYEKEHYDESPYRNLKPSVGYVGMQKCRKCHESVYQTFIQTGMGQSFDAATVQKSSADFSAEAAQVYDSFSDLHYHPFVRNDSIFVKEYRLAGTDTSYSRTEHIRYIVGSGQHTNSHMIEKNGYVYQAPITYYTQKGFWDMAPGFEGGNNSRFDRKIQLECMSCHNALPTMEQGSLNKFIEIGRGIDCERCHGPGQLHVQEKESGEIVDTAAGPDYSIVNPRRLSTELQNNVCMRCHLQGTTVLADGKTFYDFRPGMKLSQVMTTFLPKFEGGDDQMIMASHVERMMQSRCYLESGKLSCISCHDPHVSVKQTPIASFDKRCQSCHPQAQHTTVDAANLENCTSCHMPKSGSTDIPHVAVTDHYIRIPENDVKEAELQGIVSYNNLQPSDLTLARGYLEVYERNRPEPSLLDSAKRYLQAENLIENIRLAFLQKNMNSVYSYARENQAADFSDAWTAYRLGEACFQKKDYSRATAYLGKAVEEMPLVTDFKIKLALSEMLSGNKEEAKIMLEEVSREDPNNYLSYYNLAIYYRNQKDMNKYLEYKMAAEKLNPDIEQ